MLWKSIVLSSLVIILFVRYAYVEEVSASETNTDLPQTTDDGAAETNGETLGEGETAQTVEDGGQTTGSDGEETNETGEEGVTGEKQTGTEEENTEGTADTSEGETVTGDETGGTVVEGETSTEDVEKETSGENETEDYDTGSTPEDSGETPEETTDDEEEETMESESDSDEEVTSEEDSTVKTTRSEDLDEEEEVEEEEEKTEEEPDLEGEGSDIIGENWENEQINVTVDYKEPLGEYALKVASILRNNIINMFGYLMYQTKMDVGVEMFLYLHHLKSSFEANLFDVFDLIPILPDLYMRKLDHQLSLLLKRLEEIVDRKYCQVSCSAKLIVGLRCHLNMDFLLGNVKSDLILNGILTRENDLLNINNLIGNMRDTKKGGLVGIAPKIFSPHLIRIVGEINVDTPLTDGLMAYILEFLPWPVGRFDINLALIMFTQALRDTRTELATYGIDMASIWNNAPVGSMKKLMSVVIDSKSEMVERVSARVLKNGIENQLSFPNYRNTFKGVYAEINRLWELLDIVNGQNYPIEIVLASDRLRFYMDKAVLYLNYPRFTAYRYGTNEDMLIAFIDFFLLESPYVCPSLRQAMQSMKAYLNFYTGPKVITYDLFLNIIEGLMAPDLTDVIIEHMLEVKTFVLDEAPEIKRILKLSPNKKCTALMPCYFQILHMLDAEPRSGKMIKYMQMAPNLFWRYVDVEDKVTPKDIYILSHLRKVVDYNAFTREVVLSAQAVEEYMWTNKDMPITISTVQCTKQERLLSELEQVAARAPGNALQSSVNSVIEALKFKLTIINRVNVNVMKRILNAWKSPYVDKNFMPEMRRVETIIGSNQKSLDEKLQDMNPNDCIELNECYNGIVQHLNSADSKFRFMYRSETSPDTIVSNDEDGGKHNGMTVEKLIELVERIETIREGDLGQLEAAKSYMRDFSHDINMVISDIDCTTQQAMHCFKMVLDKMRFSGSLLHIDVSVAQYLLTPITCDNKNCWWIPYVELGAVSLNPIFQYILHLLGAYSADKVKSLHIKMDIYLILEYITTEDIAEVLDKFQVPPSAAKMQLLTEFLEELIRWNLISKPVYLSTKNVYEFMNNNRIPDTLNIGNLLYMKQVFQEWTTSTEVRYELHEIEESLREDREEISEILKNMFVDCYSMETCIDMMTDQLKMTAFDLPAAKPIVKLLKPDSCLNKEMCPWITETISSSTFIKTYILPAMDNAIENYELTLIERIVWKIIRTKLQNNENVIKDKIKPSEIPESVVDKLKLFIELALKNEVGADLKKYLVAARRNMDDRTIGFVLDVAILNGLLDYMYEETYDVNVRGDIKEIKKVVESNRPQLEQLLKDIRLSCAKLQKCIQNTADEFVNKGLGKSNVIKLILQLLYAKKCAENDCRWKATYDYLKARQYLNKIYEFLQGLFTQPNTPFVVTLDVALASEYFGDKGHLDEIHNAVLNNGLTSVDEKEIYILLESLQHEKNIEQPDFQSVLAAILDYVKNGQLRTRLVPSNVRMMAVMFGDKLQHGDVIAILHNAIKYLLDHWEEASFVLNDAPVIGNTQDNCVKSLYIELMRFKDNDAATQILQVLKPKPCTVETCPWTKPLWGLTVDRMRTLILNEMVAIQQLQNITLHVKLDIQAFKKVVKQCDECIVKVIEAKNNGQKNAAVILFLKLVDYSTVERYEMEYIKKDIDEYLSSGTEPKYLDVPALLVLVEILKKLCQDEAIQREIEKHKVKALYEKKTVRSIMLSCEVRCPRLTICVASIIACLHEKPNEDHPVAGVMEHILNPPRCTPETCPWIPKESKEDLMKIFEEIKERMRAVVSDEAVPIIIRVMAKMLLEKVDFTMVENMLARISKNHPNKLDLLLEQMIKDNNKLDEDIARAALKLRNYLKTKKIPEHLIWSDVHGLILWITELSEKEPEVKEYLESAVNVIAKQKAQLQKILKECPIQCVKLKTCLADLADCAKKTKSLASYWLLKIIFPDPCTAEICPWMPERPSDIDENFPIKNPAALHHSKTIILYKARKKEKYVILDLDNEKTVSLLEAFTYLADSTARRIIIVRGKGGKSLMLDFQFLKGIIKAASKGNLELDFDKDTSASICIAFKNGIHRPLKFDLTRHHVRATLVQIAEKQETAGTFKKKQTITIRDQRLGTHRLYLDVIDPNTLRQIMETTIDDVMPQDYKAVFFWSRETGEPWGSAVIEDGTPLESFLRNMPGTDYADKEVPVVVAFEGIITMNFDVHDEQVADGIENAIDSTTAILDASIHKKYMLYLPVPFRKNMIPFPVDLDNKDTLKLLVKAAKKYPVAASNESTLIIDTGEEHLSIKYDFTTDVAMYLLFGGEDGGGEEGENEGPGSTTTTTTTTTTQRPNKAPKIRWVVLTVKGGTIQMVLDLDSEQVKETLLDKFNYPARKGHVVVFNVEDKQGTAHPIAINTDDAVVGEILVSLSQSTLKQLDPFTTSTTDGKTNVVITVLGMGHLNVPVIFEDTAAGAANIKYLVGQEGDQVRLPFSAGTVEVPMGGLYEHVQEEKMASKLPLITYIGDVEIKDVVIPFHINGTYYYVTVGSSHPQTIDVLLKHNKPEAERPSLTFIVSDSSGKLQPITLQIGDQTIVDDLREAGAIVSVRMRTQATMAIVSVDDNMRVKSFILNLDHDAVFNTLKKQASEVPSDSSSKGVFFFGGFRGEVIPIILDTDEYDLKVLGGLEQFTPLDMLPIYIPNADGSSPLVGIMIQQPGKDKVSIFLNPSDTTVMRGLLQISNASKKKGVSFVVTDRKGKHHTIKIDKTNESNLKKLINMGQRLNPSHIPTMPIPADGTSLITISVMENNLKIKKVINTRDEAQMKELRAQQEVLPDTEPVMFVINPEGEGEEIRVDMRGYKDAPSDENSQGARRRSLNIAVLNPKTKPAVILNLADEDVAESIQGLEDREMRTNSPYVVFVNFEGRVQKTKLDTKNPDIMQFLLELMEKTTPMVGPIDVLLENDQPFTVFMIVDGSGRKRAIILDITNAEVKKQLIALWDGSSTKGLPLTLKGSNGQPITIHIDTSRKNVVEKLITLMEEYTPAIPVPIVAGGFADDGIIKIPILEGGRTYLINCDVRNPTISGKLRRLHGGRNANRRNPVSIMFNDVRGRPTVIQPDLNDGGVIRSLKKVCGVVTGIFDPSMTMVVNVNDASGRKRTNVIDISNPKVAEELVQRAFIEGKPKVWKRSIVNFPIMNEMGMSADVHLDVDNPETQDVLLDLTQESLGDIKYEPLINRGGNSSYTVLFTAVGAIFIDQNNKVLVEEIIAKLSDPNDPNSFRTIFKVEGKERIAYIDISNADTMHQLKELVDKYIDSGAYHPTTKPKRHILKLPCVTERNQRVLMIIDVKQPNVVPALEKVHDVASKSGKFTMKVKITEGGKLKAVYLADTTDPVLCAGLIHVSDAYKYAPADGTLLIINLSDRQNPVIFLDTTQPEVIRDLKRIAKISRNEATHFVISPMQSAESTLIPIDTRRPEVVEILLGLMQLTPSPTIPAVIANPYGPKPLVAFTMRLSNGEVRHILLNLNRAEVMQKLKELSMIKGKPATSVDIIYEDLSVGSLNLNLDLANETVTDELQSLTYRYHGIHDAIQNYPVKNPLVIARTLVLINTAMGTTTSFFIDINDLKQLTNLQGKENKIPKTSPVLIVYFKDGKKHVISVRVDAKELIGEADLEKVLNHFTNRDALILTIDNEKSNEWILLNLKSKEVVDELGAISDNVPIEKSYSTATISVDDRLQEIKLDLSDTTTKDRLRKMQTKTPAFATPFLAYSLSGSRSVLILTLTSSKTNKTVPIVIDLNVGKSMTKWKKLLTDDKPFRVSIMNEDGSHIELDIPNLFSHDTRSSLEELVSNTPPLLAPVPGLLTDILKVTIPHLNAQIIVDLNVKDEGIVKKLIDLGVPKGSPLPNHHVKFYVVQGEALVLVVLDLGNKDVIAALKKLGNSNEDSGGQAEVYPGGGYSIRLLVVSLHLPDGMIQMTIDPNNARVIDLLQSIDEGYNDPETTVAINVPLPSSQTLVVNINIFESNIRQLLDEITDLAGLLITSVIVVPPSSVNPIFSMITKIGTKSLLIVIDPNDESIMQVIKEDRGDDYTGTIKIDYIGPEGNPDYVYVNLTSGKTISIIRKIAQNVTVYAVPSKTDQILQIQTPKKRWQLNLNDPKVVEVLTKLSSKLADKSKVWMVEFITELDCRMIIYINFLDPQLEGKIEGSVPVQPPTWEMKIVVTVPGIRVKVPEVIVIPPHGIYQLIMVEITGIGTVVWDINNDTIFMIMIKITDNRCDSKKCLIIEVPDGNGEGVIIRIEVSSPSIIFEIKKIPRHPHIAYEVVPGKLFPILIIIWKEKVYGLDLNNHTTIQWLIIISNPSPEAYTVKIPLPLRLVIVYILLDDIAAKLPWTEIVNATLPTDFTEVTCSTIWTTHTASQGSATTIPGGSTTSGSQTTTPSWEIQTEPPLTTTKKPNIDITWPTIGSEPTDDYDELSTPNWEMTEETVPPGFEITVETVTPIDITPLNTGGWGGGTTEPEWTVEAETPEILTSEIPIISLETEETEEGNGGGEGWSSPGSPENATGIKTLPPLSFETDITEETTKGRLNLEISTTKTTAGWNVSIGTGSTDNPIHTVPTGTIPEWNQTSPTGTGIPGTSSTATVPEGNVTIGTGSEGGTPETLSTASVPDGNITIGTGSEGGTPETLSTASVPEGNITIGTGSEGGTPETLSTASVPDGNITIGTGSEGGTPETLSTASVPEGNITIGTGSEGGTPETLSTASVPEGNITIGTGSEGGTPETLSTASVPEGNITIGTGSEGGTPETISTITIPEWNMTIGTGSELGTPETLSTITIPEWNMTTGIGSGVPEMNITIDTSPGQFPTATTGWINITVETVTVGSPTTSEWNFTMETIPGSTITSSDTEEPDWSINTFTTPEEIESPEIHTVTEGTSRTPQGGLGTLTPLPTTPPFTTKYTTTTEAGNWSMNVSTGEVEIEGRNMFWVALNLTNYITFEEYTYIFDVSNVAVLEELKLYVQGLTQAQKTITIAIPIPGGSFTLYIDMYDVRTFELFWRLTIMSTGKDPMFVRINIIHFWWNFTITDNYNRQIRIEVDVNNQNVVQKLEILTSWYQGGGYGVKISGTLLNRQEFQIIIDISCATTILNLQMLMVESHGGPSKPLIPLPPLVVKPIKQIIDLEIRLPGAEKPIKIWLNIADNKVWETLIQLDKNYKEGPVNVVIIIEKGTKTYTIKLNLGDRNTLRILLQISEDPMTEEEITAILGLLRLPSFLTIQISDGKESLPITIDVSDDRVTKILKDLQPKNGKYASVIEYTDSNNVTHKIKLNVNDRQIIGILLAVGIPTICLRETPHVRLLTVIFVKHEGEYTSIFLDLANRMTIFFFIEVVRNYQNEFKQRSYVEVRDDNGQYIPIAVDFFHEGFVKELIKKAGDYKRHVISSEDLPFVVFCLPRGSTYRNMKFRLSHASVEKFKTFPYTEKGIRIHVKDKRTYFNIDPTDRETYKRLLSIPGIALIQASRPKSMTIIYTEQEKIIRPIYLNMKDVKTLNNLIQMHNDYSKTGGGNPLTLMRFKTAANTIEYLMVFIRSQVALNALEKVSAQVGDHHFSKQEVEKIASINIPQSQGRGLIVNLNLADMYTLSELRRMTREQLPNRNVQTVTFVDAYGDPLDITLDFTDQLVIRQLMKLSVR